MNPEKLFCYLKYIAKTLFFPPGSYKISRILDDRPIEQVIWLGTSPIKWGSQSQITSSKALPQTSPKKKLVEFFELQYTD